jgi:hypothetical protein
MEIHSITTEGTEISLCLLSSATQMSDEVQAFLVLSVCCITKRHRHSYMLIAVNSTISICSHMGLRCVKKPYKKLLAHEESSMTFPKNVRGWRKGGQMHGRYKALTRRKAPGRLPAHNPSYHHTSQTPERRSTIGQYFGTIRHTATIAYTSLILTSRLVATVKIVVVSQISPITNSSWSLD